jgi:hypothetical protein
MPSITESVMKPIERIEIAEENGQGIFRFDSIFAS